MLEESRASFLRFAADHLDCVSDARLGFVGQPRGALTAAVTLAAQGRRLRSATAASTWAMGCLGASRCPRSLPIRVQRSSNKSIRPRDSLSVTASGSPPTDDGPSVRAPGPSLWRRHLGAILIAGAILIVGAGGVAAWIGTRTPAAAPPPVAQSASSSASTSVDTQVSSSSGLDFNDTRYIATLRGANIPVQTGTEVYWVGMGHKACEALDAGNSATKLITGLASDTSGTVRYSYQQSASLVGASIGAYCPSYASQIGY